MSNIEAAKTWLQTDEAKQHFRDAFQQVAEMQMHLDKTTKLTPEQLNTPFIPVLASFKQAVIKADNAKKLPYKITWQPSKQTYTDGHNCFLGKWKVGSVHYSVFADKGSSKRIQCHCALAGIKEDLGMYETVYEAKARLEQVIEKWLSQLKDNP
jgi:hypothetical protein